MRLSIVSTLYRSSPYLDEFYGRIRRAADTLTGDFEMILVNDGSPDDSLAVALRLRETDPRIVIVDLSQNFGHHKAMMCGLRRAQGELVFLVDCDLEEEPELLIAFHEKLMATGADVIYGVQQKRKGHLFERVSGALFFKVFNFFSTHPIPANHLTARLMTRRYVASLCEHREREFVMSGLWALTGYVQVAISVTKHHKPSSAYGLRRKFALLVDAITSFSAKPLVLIFYTGCILVTISGLAALDLIIRRLFFGVLLEGWASLIVSIWLLGGITIFWLGVIGIYLSKIFTEVKQRPHAIIRAIHGPDASLPTTRADGLNPQARAADEI